LPELGKRNSGSGIQNSAPASEKPPELRQNSGAQHYIVAKWLPREDGVINHQHPSQILLDE
jgi:hypothetical protein